MFKDNFKNRIEDNIVTLAKNDICLQSTLQAFNENMRNINENLNNVTNISIKLAERIKVLESDLNERSIKKHLISALMLIYPLVVVAMMVMTNMDHNKLKELMAEAHSLMRVIE